MRNCLLGVDLGTSSVKAILYSESGDRLYSASAAYETYHPCANRAEQNAADWWHAAQTCLRHISSRMDRNKDLIAGIAVSSQAPSLLLLDSDGAPLCPAIIWMDRRADAEAAELEHHFGTKRYRAAFGATPDTYYLAPRLYWVKKHEPELYARIHRIHLTNTYINFMLTGESALDFEQTGITHLVDRRTLRYSDEMADLLELDLEQVMPQLRHCYEVIGTVSRQASDSTGLPAGIPVVCGTTDGITAPLEAGILRQGMAADIAGTSSLLYYAAEEPLPEESPLMNIRQPFPIPEVPWHILAPVNSAGASLKWYTELSADMLLKNAQAMGYRNPYQAMDALAETAPAGSGGLLFFPYLSGERAPLWNSYVKGMFIGMTARTGQAEMIRSILEGTAFAIRETMEIACRYGIAVDLVRVTGGGANSDIWLKIKASVLKKTIHASVDTGGAAMGDAILAGYGVGLFPDFCAAVSCFQRVTKIIEPVREWSERYDALFPLFIRMREHLDGDLLQLQQMAL